MGWSIGLAGPVPFVCNLHLACNLADLHKSFAVQPIIVDSSLSKLMSVTIVAASVKKQEVIMRQGNS